MEGEDGGVETEALVEESMIARATAVGVEKEKCVVSHYKTSTEQLDQFKELLSTCDKNRIPLEWVIDIADESNGWFYGTAYHYNNATNMLHVMVPDKHNPTFDGEIPLDYRTVHLVECVDGKTMALFNKIIRDSVTKVRWEVEWFEEGAGHDKQMVDSGQNGPQGRWVLSIARYYIRMANQVLVEDEEFGQDSHGFVLVAADMNLRLRACFRGKGIVDFVRLITENIVQSAPHAIESSQKAIVPVPQGAGGAARGGVEVLGGGGVGVSGGNIKKLAHMSRSLREAVSDILDDRERLLAENERTCRAFQAFVLNGDLDAGWKLMSHTDITIQSLTKKGDDSRSKKALELEVRQEIMDTVAEDAWYLSERIEKSSAKLARAQEAGGGKGERGGGSR